MKQLPGSAFRNPSAADTEDWDRGRLARRGVEYIGLAAVGRQPSQTRRQAVRKKRRALGSPSVVLKFTFEVRPHEEGPDAIARGNVMPPDHSIGSLAIDFQQLRCGLLVSASTRQHLCRVTTVHYRRCGPMHQHLENR